MDMTNLARWPRSATPDLLKTDSPDRRRVGRRQRPASTCTTRPPARKLADVANLGAAETEQAHRAPPNAAWPAWRGKTAKERARS